MTDTLHLEIVSPERLLKDAQVAMVVGPGADGDFGAMPAHAPMMSTIRPGVIQIYETEAGEPEQFFVKSGLAQISATGLTILAEDLIDIGSVDATELAAEIAKARDAVNAATDDMGRDLAEAELEWRTVLSDLVS